MNAAILLVTTAWLAGSDCGNCGTPSCAPACDCCEVKEKKSFFDRFKKKPKCEECCDPCATCAPACPTPCEPTCECEDPCKKKKKSSLFDMFKKKKKCEECCDTCSDCDSCGAPAVAPIVVPGKSPEVVPLPMGDSKEKSKAPAQGTNITPTSSPKPLELGSSPY